MTVSANYATTGIALVKCPVSNPCTTNYTAAGQTLSYNYKVTNTGSISLIGVAVADDLVSPVNCPNPTLAGFASEICTGSYLTTAGDVTAGSVTNNATATGTDIDYGNPVASVPSSATIYALPTVTNVSPNSGTAGGGTTVTLTGTGFVGASSVDFGGTLAPAFTVNSVTSITVTSPPHSVGTVDVHVTNPGGVSPSNPPNDQYTYS